MENWYALFTRSAQERVVVDRLDSVGIEAFYAFRTEKVVDIHRNHRERERKFFPGYVFARFSFENRRPVIMIPQVVSILGSGPDAISIPDTEVEAVRQLVNSPAETAVESCPFVNAGDQVRVTYGPLRGQVGYFAMRKNSARVIVSIQMLAQSISAEVDADALELVERAPRPQLLRAA